MALPARVIWEVRGGSGADTNGGGFVEGGTGTDYSQQDSAQFNGTNLTVDASTNTDVAPDGHTPASTDVDNIIQITAGAGFTQGFYRIVSIQSGKWRLDRSPAATNTSGGTWALGGALNTIGKAYTNAVSLNTIYVKKTATYTLTAAISITSGAFVEMIGYDSARTDYTASSITGRPLVTTATNSTILFDFGSNSTGLIWRNFEMTNTAGTRAECLDGTGIGLRNVVFDRIKFSGFSRVYSGSAFSAIMLQRCEVANCTNSGQSAIGIPNNDTQGISLFNCYVHDNAGRGIDSDANGPIILVRTIFDSNGGDDVRKTSSGTFGGTNQQVIYASHCVFYGGSGAGIIHSTGSTNDNMTHVENCIFYGKGTYGIRNNNSRVPYCVAGGANAFGANSTADKSGVPNLPGDVALSGDPFTDAANGDFTLNNTAGAGAACRNAGLPAAALP